jgi:restriction system protein
VVETKNMKGWIYGGARDTRWTQLIFHSKTYFQNPLRQNDLHVRAIADFCAIEDSIIHSVVVFWGSCEFKTAMPQNVVTWLDYPRYIKSKKQVLLSDTQVDSVCNRLHTSKGGIPILSNLRHAQVIKSQYNSPDICPRCGGRLLERTTRRGQAAGQRFIGCDNYPKCRFTRNLESP